MNNARELAANLLHLLRHEQSAMADFLVALADFDNRRVWLKLGHSSLFTFLHRELGLSKGASHFRKTAAEIIQRYPEVVEPLRDGRLCITSIVELAKVITPENRTEILPRFFHTSKQEAKAIAVEICPRNVVPHRDVVMAVPTPAMARHVPLALPSIPSQTEAVPAAGPARLRHTGAVVLPVEPAPPPPSPPARPPRSAVEPLNADLARLHATVSKRFLAKLKAARDALSHSHPGADIETILEVGLDLVIERHAKRKGIVAKPRMASAPVSGVAGEQGGGDRHIPSYVQREVWTRDGGCCQWPVDGGGICGSTHRVQFDHIVPRARGGASTVGNVRLACQVHNLLAARQVFGDAFMDRFASARSRETVLDTR